MRAAATTHRGSWCAGPAQRTSSACWICSPTTGTHDPSSKRGTCATEPTDPTTPGSSRATACWSPRGVPEVDHLTQPGRIRGTDRRAHHGGRSARTRVVRSPKPGPWLQWRQPKGPMRSMSVVVLDELGEDAAEVTWSDDPQVIEALPTNNTDPAFHIGVGVRARTGVATTWAPLERHTSSKDRVNLACSSSDRLVSSPVSVLRVTPGGRCPFCKHPYDPDLAVKQRALRWGAHSTRSGTGPAADKPVDHEMLEILGRTQGQDPAATPATGRPAGASLTPECWPAALVVADRHRSVRPPSKWMSRCLPLASTSSMRVPSFGASPRRRGASKRVSR